MKYLPIILLVSFLNCKSTNMSQTISDWSVNPTNNTTKIKAVTSYYGGNAGLQSHTLFVLNHLGFEIFNTTNPIITKPKILFGRWCRYSVSCSDTDIIISGEVVQPSIGGSSEITSANFSGTAIVKGSGQFGTPWFERMTVIAEAIREATIYYSDN
jgi:hypothetical protein